MGTPSFYLHVFRTRQRRGIVPTVIRAPLPFIEASYTHPPIGTDTYTHPPIGTDTYTHPPIGTDTYTHPPIGTDTHTHPYNEQHT